MEDLTTELGFQDFLADRYAEVERAICARTRDRFHAEEAVASGVLAVWNDYKAGKLTLVAVDIVAYWKQRACWELTKIREKHERALYGSLPAKKDAVDEYSESYRQPRSRRQTPPEPSSEGADVTVIKKEDGQAASKQLSAIILFASNNEEFLAVLTALTEMIHANESISDDGDIKINWSELARQSNSILRQDRFDSRSVQTSFRKFTRHASAYLSETAA